MCATPSGCPIEKAVPKDNAVAIGITAIGSTFEAVDHRFGSRRSDLEHRAVVAGAARVGGAIEIACSINGQTSVGTVPVLAVTGEAVDATKAAAGEAAETASKAGAATVEGAKEAIATPIDAAKEAAKAAARSYAAPRSRPSRRGRCRCPSH